MKRSFQEIYRDAKQENDLTGMKTALALLIASYGCDKQTDSMGRIATLFIAAMDRKTVETVADFLDSDDLTHELESELQDLFNHCLKMSEEECEIGEDTGWLDAEDQPFYIN